MLGFSSISAIPKALLVPLGRVLRDLTPWLIRGIVGWLLAVLRRGRQERLPCTHCPFAPEPAAQPDAPRAAGTNPDIAGGSRVASLAGAAAGLWLAAIAAGCAPDSAYVAADRATFDAIAPEYAAYVSADPALDDARRSRRLRTLQAWRVRLEQADPSDR